MITYQEETYEDLKEEIIPLLVEHWKEIGTLDKETVKLKPNWVWYKTLSDEGFLYVTTVRKDTELIGYCVCIIAPHIHYTDIMVAENDILFLKKEYRKGLVGYKLLRYTISNLKKKVQLIIIGTKVKYNFSSILTKLGFELTEYKFTMEI
jgi:hypothetical protein